MGKSLISATCRDISNAADRRSLDVTVYGPYLRPGTDTFIDEMDCELRVAADLDALLIRVRPGDQEYQKRTGTHWCQAITDLETLSRWAAERGLGMAVEKHGRALTNMTEGAQAVIDAVDSDHCKLNWQPLFGLPADGLLAEARELAPVSNNVNLPAFTEEGTRDRCLLADAYFDVKAILAEFQNRGFEGYVEMEFIDEKRDFNDAVNHDCEFIRSALQ